MIPRFLERFDIDYFLIAMPPIPCWIRTRSMANCSNVEAFRAEIPAAFWHALREEKLIDAKAPLP